MKKRILIKAILSAIVLFTAALLTVAARAQQRTQPDRIYDSFNRFCIENFGAETEEEVYNMFGKELKVIDEGSWMHISDSSACICWETNLPAKTYIEYGISTEYGSRTSEPERHFYLHLRYIRDLEPNTTYHYRLISVDERGNRIFSEDRTFAARRITDAIRIPGDLGGPPYTLDKPNTYYLVTADIIADATAFNVVADGITLDLGGHTVIYDKKPGSPDPARSSRRYGFSAVRGCSGIRTADGRRGIKIVNGIIKQEKGGVSQAAAYSPLFLRRPHNTEIAGITVEYSGAQITGFAVDSAYEGTNVHHNVVIDRGTKLTNRHRGVSGIAFNVEGAGTILSCHHNLLKRVRQTGIGTSSYTDIYSNEIYIDSWTTNSFGVSYYGSRIKRPIHEISIHNNRVFGTGYHPIGIGSGRYAYDVKVFANYIQMQGQAPSTYRWPSGPGDPLGQEHPVNGIRIHEGPQKDIDYSDNTVVVKARGVKKEGVMMRGLWITPAEAMENVVFRNNLVKQVAQNKYADGYAVAALGTNSGNPQEQIFYYDNTIMANMCNVRFGDNYGHGANHHFVGTTFVRIGNNSRYKTIKLGWKGWNRDSYGHSFLDSKFEGGADYNKVGTEGADSAHYDFTVEWYLDLTAQPGSEVSIKDKTGKQVFNAAVNSNGKLPVPLRQYTYRPRGKLFYTPHTVTVVKEGSPSVSRQVIMDQNRQLDLRANQPPGG